MEVKVTNYSTIKRYFANTPHLFEFAGFLRLLDQSRYPKSVRIDQASFKNLLRIIQEYKIPEQYIAVICWVWYAVGSNEKLIDIKKTLDFDSEYERQKIQLYKYLFGRPVESSPDKMMIDPVIFQSSVIKLQAKSGRNIKIDNSLLSQALLHIMARYVKEQAAELNSAKRKAFPGKGNIEPFLNQFLGVWARPLFRFFREELDCKVNTTHELIGRIFNEFGLFPIDRNEDQRNVNKRVERLIKKGPK